MPACAWGASPKWYDASTPPHGPVYQPMPYPAPANTPLTSVRAGDSQPAEPKDLTTRSPARARARFGPPFIALMYELSITALDQSSAPAACSSASSASCSCCHMPASCQSRSRRQQVIREPKPGSCGTNSHGIPVCSTNKMPDSTLRSSSRLRPG